MDNQSIQHTRWNCTYHIVFIPRYRKKQLYGRKQALLGHPPKGLGSPDIHHGGQMPGAAKHEVIPSRHRTNQALHQNKYNQGVTDEMRTSDKELHWWYRAREQGADDVLPDWIYDD